MDMNGLVNLALRQINNNPQMLQEIQNSPVKNNIYNILSSGDQEKGKELASNLCNSCNMSREQAVTSSFNFFQNMGKR